MSDFDDVYDMDPVEESFDDFDLDVHINNSDESKSLTESDIESSADDEEWEETIDVKAVSDFIQEIVIVKPENRQTSNVMSKFEMTNCISIRTMQIAQFNNCMVDITGLDRPDLMAKRELMMRKCPLTLRRRVGKLRNKKTGEWEQYYEYWDPNLMTFAVTYLDVL